MQELARPRFPRLSVTAHKHQRGRVLIIGGSVGASGAVRLAASGALAIGCGLVRLAVPALIRAECAEDPALMVRGLPCTIEGALAFRAITEIPPLAEGSDAMVMGPGLGRHEDTEALVRRLVPRVTHPLVLDADALNALAGAALPRGRAVVWTPHEAEAARLLSWPVQQVRERRAEACHELARQCGGVVVLKGAGTLIGDGTQLWRCAAGNPGLAIGGTGDVLAGMIGALLSQGLTPLHAAQSAVWMHATAADHVAQRHGERGLSLRELLAEIPRVLSACSE